MSDAISGGNVHAINYFVALKYVEALRDIASAPNEKVILLPMESTGILGSLAGIAEIAKSSFGQGSGGAAGPVDGPPGGPWEPKE